MFKQENVSSSMEIALGTFTQGFMMLTKIEVTYPNYYDILLFNIQKS